MRRSLRWLPRILGLFLMSGVLLSCGGDDGGSSATAEQACSHYCSCSFAAQIPSCQSTCVSGINMSSNPSACTKCTADSSCTELQNNSCQSACGM